MDQPGSPKPGSIKRPREQDQEQETQEEIIKRQKSYKDIITLLEEEEDEPTEDLSSLVSTLLEEISSPGPNPVHPGSFELDPVHPGSCEPGSGGEEEEVEKVMKHLLEASDDELGIPNMSSNSGTVMDGCDGVVGGHVDGGDLLFPVGDCLWEFEDHEAVNYYNNLLQSDVIINW